MRRAIISTLLVLQSYGLAFAIDDAAVCSSLRSTGGTGLYLAYPAFSSMAVNSNAKNCDALGGFCLTKVADRNLFDESARFYFVPQSIPRTEEGVWHIRTQTKAMNLDGADQAYLARAAVRTRCSPTRLLDAFQGGWAYVPLNDYIDHHAVDSEARLSPEIGNFFHFAIQDPPGGPACIATDDRSKFKDVHGIYGFSDDVARKQKFAARHFGISAHANTSYAGLSSEFAYYDQPDPPCFGFAAPKPTRTEYLGQNIDWKPSSTMIWIKRLRGREVIPVSRNPIVVQWIQ